MRIPINLASQPYENLRPWYTSAGLAAIMLIALTLLIVWNVRQNRNETRLLTEQRDRIGKDLENLNREQRELEQWLARPDVQEIRERSAFLNSILVRKSLSWTRMFMDLEKTLPDRVQVTAIRPILNQYQQPELKLTVASPTVQQLVEYLKILESSPQFGAPVVDSQHFPAEKATDPNITVSLSVVYHQNLDSLSSTSQETTKVSSNPPSATLAHAVQNNLEAKAMRPTGNGPIAHQQAERLSIVPQIRKGER